jgi:iron transport multicopper oxidase
MLLSFLSSIALYSLAKLVDATNVYAVLRYEGAPEAEPATEQTTAMGNAPLVEENLHALINPGAPGGSDPADVVIDLAIGRSTIDGSVAFTFNGVQYKPPTLPTLLKVSFYSPAASYTIQ